MYSAYTDKGYHWFHSGPSNHWYDALSLGLSLRVPIFDGLDKRYKKRKALLDIENIKLTQEDTRKNLQTQYLNATSDLLNNQRNFKNKETTTCWPKMFTKSPPTAIGKASLPWQKSYKTRCGWAKHKTTISARITTTGLPGSRSWNWADNWTP